MITLEEAIKHCEEVADYNEEKAKEYKHNQDALVRVYHSLGASYSEDYSKSSECLECAKEHRQLAEWLKRLKRIEDYIADGKDDIECTYSLCFWEIEAVMDGEIWRSDKEVKADV